MAKLGLYCRNATTFLKDGGIDEGAFRLSLQKFIGAEIGIYVASSGGGEGHSLTKQECATIYRIALEECKGKIPVYANPPEQVSVRETREHNAVAIAAGMELISIYAITSRHAFKPTDAELIAFFDDVLADVKTPVAVAINPPVMAHTPKPEVVAAICNKHRQVTAINLSECTDSYLIQIRDRLTRDVDIFSQVNGSLNKFTLGSKGIYGTDANLIPKAFRRYANAYDAGDFAELGRAYGDIKHFTDYVKKWHNTSPRWIKMAMRIFKLPGWEGGIREPYRMAPEAEIQSFADGLLRLRIPEIDDLARAAGLTLP